MAGRKIQPVFGQPRAANLADQHGHGHRRAQDEHQLGQHDLHQRRAQRPVRQGHVGQRRDDRAPTWSRVPACRWPRCGAWPTTWRRATPIRTKAKKHLAWAVVREYHGQAAADEALAEWNRVRSGRELPSDMPAVVVRDEEIGIVELLVLTGAEPSKNQARRDIEQGGRQHQRRAHRQRPGAGHAPRWRCDQASASCASSAWKCRRRGTRDEGRGMRYE